MVYARSSTTEFASVWFTGRLATDPLNTLQPGQVLKAGSSPFQRVIEGRNRYTDYFGIALDPTDTSVWILGMYAQQLDTLGTWVGNIAFSTPGPAPAVTTVSANSGSTAGGTTVTITGTGFLSGATVSVGGTAATNINVASANTITATTPSHAAGAVNVVVTNPDNQSGTLNNGFTFVAPAAVPIPSVGEWGLVALAVLLAGALVAVAMRRPRTT
jgi:hypothetical protein